MKFLAVLIGTLSISMVAQAGKRDLIDCVIHDPLRPGYALPESITIRFPHFAGTQTETEGVLFVERSPSQAESLPVTLFLTLKKHPNGSRQFHSLTVSENRRSILSARNQSDGSGGEFTVFHSTMPILRLRGEIGSCLYLDGTITKPGVSGSN